MVVTKLRDTIYCTDPPVALSRALGIETAAAAAHMANRAYCQALGDFSQPTWEEAPYWQRLSCLKGVEGALAGNTPEDSHLGWMEEKVRTGWTYGPVKDIDAKTHPCMVPYAQLPPEQQKKDEIFLTTARQICRLFGLT